MRTIGSDGSDDDHRDKRCPHCRQFVANAAKIVQLKELIDNKIKDLTEALSKYEWTVIENSINIKNMKRDGLELDQESFVIAFNESVQFLNMLTSINVAVDKLVHEYKEMNEQV